VARVFWIGVELWSLRTCIQWWKNPMSDTKRDRVDRPYGRDCTLESFEALKS